MQVRKERQNLAIYRCQRKELTFNEKHTGKFYSHMKRWSEKITFTEEKGEETQVLTWSSAPPRIVQVAWARALSLSPGFLVCSE